MSDIEDDNSDWGESGNDVTNNNYRVLGGQGVQHLNNISLPCILYLERDLGAAESDKQTSPKRTFHIEISEEIHHDHLGQVIPFCCHSFPPEQGFGMVTPKHIGHAIEAHGGTDVQKMSYMINCVKEFEDMLRCFAFDKDSRLHERFEHAENRFHSEIVELTKGICTIFEVVGKIHDMVETCSKTNVRKTTNHDTQTDTPTSSSSNDVSVVSLFHSISNKHGSINMVDFEDIEEETCLAYDFRQKDNETRKDNGTRNEEISESSSEKGTGNFTTETSTEIKSVHDWTIDHTNWSTCLEQKDSQHMKKLLKERKLPDKNLLDKACCIFGISSTLVSDICIAICSYLRGKASENLKDIWPAYFYDKDAKPASEEITFIAIKADQSALDIGNEYRIYIREDSICSPESKDINKLESEEMNSSDLSGLINCVNENSVTLMHKHSKLTMVSASCKMSKDYGTHGTIINKQCITLYVHVKGFIPLQEKPFPEKLGNYHVDVREAVFKQFVGGRPNEYHENVRMGCAITAKTEDEDGHVLVGTLGGFLEHPQYGLCCITCAHVICRDLNKIANHGSIQAPVFQPCCKGSPPFGHLISALYNPGGLGDSGVDLALIKVDSRHPVDGRFPDTDKIHQIGFSEDKPMTYCSGKICELTKLNKASVVIKYGCFTELTRGVFRLQGGAVRTSNHVGKHAGSDFLLHNQIEILSAGEESFAMDGDSGAFVFVQENDELSLIGMLEGGLDDGRFIVTPIKDIIKALELPMEGTLKTFVNNFVPSSPFSDQLLNPNSSFRCSTPSRPFSVSRTDSAISMNTSVSEDSSSTALLSLVDEKLKVANDKMSLEVAKHVLDIKTEISENMDEKLQMIKTDLKQEIQQSIHQQTEMIKQMLSGFLPQKK